MTRVADPRARLLDAALAIIDAEGLRGLTHRRLEDEAGLARGSARYHLGTNDQIITATLEHAALGDLQVIDSALAQLGLSTLAGGTSSVPKMAAVMVSALLDKPEAIRARYELLLEATRRPSLRAEARRWRAHFVDTTEIVLTAAGLDDPHGAAVLLVATLDGLVLDAIITERSSAPQLAERAAAAILQTFTTPS